MHPPKLNKKVFWDQGTRWFIGILKYWIGIFLVNYIRCHEYIFAGDKSDFSIFFFLSVLIFRANPLFSSFKFPLKGVTEMIFIKYSKPIHSHSKIFPVHPSGSVLAFYNYF